MLTGERFPVRNLNIRIIIIGQVGEGSFPKEYALLFSQAIQKVEAAKAIRLDTTAAFRKQQEENRIKLMGIVWLINRR